MIASRAPGTIDAYRRAFLRWKSFAASSAEIQAFPAKREFVALYLQYLLDTTFSSHSVDMAVYAIQWAHSLAGLPSPTESPIVQTVKEAAKRIDGAPLVHRKDPVSPDMIRQLLIRSNLHNLLELRNVCIFVLAYSGFFRIDEVLHVRYGDIHFRSGHVALNVQKSKTDQLRRGNEVVISQGLSNLTCPVAILRRYVSEV